MWMDEEDLEHLQNPLDHELTLDNTSDLCLTLKLFIANINLPVEVYNANFAAILRCHPNDNIFTHNLVKHIMRHLTGVVPLIHDMCINTCIAYTGPYQDLERCPLCDEPQYNMTALEEWGEEKGCSATVSHNACRAAATGIVL